MKKGLVSNAYLSVLILGIAFLFYILPAVGITSSSLREFNATPDGVAFNWTNSYTMNITITANNSNTYNITVLVQNSPTWITGNYSQHTVFASNSRYNTTCFSGSYVNLLVVNATGNYTNTTAALVNASSENLTLILNATCPPGKYYGLITIRNSSNTTEQANITALIDVPITTENELNTTTGIATFKGIFNGSGYHSYYLNASNLSNARGISINLVWNDSSKDLDMFILNGSNYAGKSINSNTNSELINYTYPINLSELRIAGNITSPVSYNGTIYFTTLNLTNATNNATFQNYYFAEMSVLTSQSLNLTLRNDGNLAHTNVQEMKEIFHLDNFTAAGTSNFSVLIPSYATKIRAFVVWRGGSNVTLNLFMPNGTLAGTSNGKKMNANISGFMQEEYVETTQIPSTAGIWKVGIVNNSGSDSYTIMVRFWVNPSDWITTNYSASTFNQTSNSVDYYLNFSVPATAIAGNYSGYMIYRDNNSATQQMKLDLNVTSAVLVVNNTLQSDTIYLKDNIGFNKTESNEVNITINNTGNQDITFETTSNSTNLSYGSYTIFLNYSHPSTISANQSGILRINFTINTTNTSNQAGIYRGWIYLNATEAYPYQGFNLSMQFNLTNTLVTNVSTIVSRDGDSMIGNVSAAENVTVYINATYQNGTRLTDLQLGNFSLYLRERNATSYRYPTSGYLTTYNLSGASDANASVYNSTQGRNEINFTYPSRATPGGFYSVYVDTAVNRSGILLSGNISSSTFLIVNNTGLSLTTASDGVSGSVTSTTALYYNVSIRNYGPVIALGNITMTASCGSSGATVEVSSREDNCGTMPSSGVLFPMNITENGTELCWYRWRVTPAANKSDTCVFNITTTDANFGNITGITLTINTTSGGGTSTSGGGGGTTGCSVDADCAWNYYCQATVCKALNCAADEEIKNHRCAKKADAISIVSYGELIEIMPLGSNSTDVTVKNTGSKGAFTAKLSASVDSDINATSVSPSSCSLGINATCTFTVSFNASRDASIGNHTGTLKAYKSDDESISESKTFVVRVAPTQERIDYIKQLYSKVSDNFTKYNQLFSQINSSGLNLSAANLTNAANLLKEINTTLMLINAYINNGTYDLADPMLINLQSTMNTQLEERMKTLKNEYDAKLGLSSGAVIFWAVVIIIIAGVAGFLIYLFLPPAGYTPRHGYTPKKDMVKKMQTAIFRAKEKSKKIKIKRRR